MGDAGQTAIVECLRPFAAYQTTQGFNGMGVYFRCRVEGTLVERGDGSRDLRWVDAATLRQWIDDDPAQFYNQEPPYEYTKNDETYQLRIKLPFVDKQEVDLSRHDQDLIIRIGSFKRHVPMPRSVQNFKTAGAEMTDNQLTVTFVKPEVQPQPNEGDAS